MASLFSSEGGKLRRARVFNFSAGPGAIPEEVLHQARAEFTDWNGSGQSALELPFTGPDFKTLLAKVERDLRELIVLPENYQVLFMHGGASAQFALVPLNLLNKKGCADYIETGHWSNRAIFEARRYGDIRVAASSASTGFDRIPKEREWQLDPGAAYCHITTNETANGIEYHWIPDSGEVPLVADMTSNFLTRPFDSARFGLIYASAQKNIGPAGLTLVLIRKDLICSALPATPSVFDYKVQSDNGSLFNTPLTYGIYIAGLMFQWIKRQGGLEEMERRSQRKSQKLYAAIDESSDFYNCPALIPDRSRTNVCFTLPDEALTRQFLNESSAHGLINIKGHPAVGGVRVSLYNGMPEEGVDALTVFMAEFSRDHR